MSATILNFSAAAAARANPFVDVPDWVLAEHFQIKEETWGEALLALCVGNAAVLLSVLDPEQRPSYLALFARAEERGPALIISVSSEWRAYPAGPNPIFLEARSRERRLMVSGIKDFDDAGYPRLLATYQFRNFTNWLQQQ